MTQADYPDKHDGFFARYWNHGYLVGCHIGGGPRKCIREYNKALVRDDGIALSKALHYLSDLACPFHTIPTSLETHVSYERYVKSNLEEICALVEEVEPVTFLPFISPITLATISFINAPWLLSALKREDFVRVNAITALCLERAVSYTAGMLISYRELAL